MTTRTNPCRTPGLATNFPVSGVPYASFTLETRVLTPALANQQLLATRNTAGPRTKLMYGISLTKLEVRRTWRHYGAQSLAECEKGTTNYIAQA